MMPRPEATQTHREAPAQAGASRLRSCRGRQKTNCGMLLRGAGVAAARVLARISARSNHNRCATKLLKRISPAEKEICI